MDIVVGSKGTDFAADWGAGARPCAVGRGGIAVKLREGDGITPIGAWPLRAVLYRADRLAAPKTKLGPTPVAPADGWCETPGDPDYNRPVSLPHRAGSESLWREDGLYDVVVIVGFNDAPVVPGKGSAIFLHVAKPDYAPTEGCVALKLEDLMDALAQLETSDRLIVSPSP